MHHRTSVPTCLPPPDPRGAERPSRVFHGEVLVLYVTALAYTAFDVFLFHMLSPWVAAAVEVVELAPIAIGIWFYYRTASRRTSRFPRMLTVPLLSVSLQIQLLLFAAFYRWTGSM